jgi:predicted NUDIX family NTP pyrophosphohydrolase
MKKTSAGILLYRLDGRRGAPALVEVLLVHPGGPLWANKDDGAWSIPKGLLERDEEPLAAARREFAEETGGEARGPAIPLSPLRQASGKVVHGFAVEGDFDPASLRSNLFEMEWPPRSGAMREFPEVDRAAWFDPDLARRKLHPGQVAFIDELLALLGAAAVR